METEVVEEAGAEVSGDPAVVPFRVRHDPDGTAWLDVGGHRYSAALGDWVIGQRGDAALVRHVYGKLDNDGLWRNCSLFDLRRDLPPPPEGRRTGRKRAPWSGRRRYDLAWHHLEARWARCEASTQALVRCPDALEWARGVIEACPRTPAERITAAEAAVGRMREGGEVSAALVRATAVLRKGGE